MYRYTYTHIFGYTQLSLDKRIGYDRSLLLRQEHRCYWRAVLIKTVSPNVRGDSDQNIQCDISGCWWSLMKIKTLNMMPAGFQPEVARDPSRVHHLQLLQLFTRCAQLYKNSHGFPCPVKPSTKSAPRYFSSAGHVKSTVDPSRDTGEPPAAWTFNTDTHELY